MTSQRFKIVSSRQLLFGCRLACTAHIPLKIVVFLFVSLLTTFLKLNVNIFRTAIGIRAKDGVVLAVEKLVTSKLYEFGANKRIFNIDKHIGMCIAGLLADARAVVEIARDEAANYRNQYRSPIPLKVCLFVHKITVPSVTMFGDFHTPVMLILWCANKNLIGKKFQDLHSRVKTNIE